MTARVPVAALIAVVAAVVGCGAGSRIGRGIVPVMILGAAIVGVVAVARAGPVGAIAGVVAVFLLAAPVSARAHHGVRNSPLAVPVARGATATLTGRAVDDPDVGRYAAGLLVRVELGWTHRTVLVRATGDDAMRLARLRAGDRVVVRGRLDPLLRAGDHRARRRHAVARLADAHLLAFRAPTGVRAGVEALRARVLSGVDRLAPDRRGLFAGFLIGETQDVPAGTIAAFRASGLSHLLAVSGANVAFVLAVVGPALRRLRLGPRTAVALLVVAGFAVVTRGEPSVLRASVLAAGSLLATAVGRPAARLRLLGYAVIVLLIGDPFLVGAPGFWLSVGASAGIVCGAPALDRRLPGPAPLRSALAVSLAAQAGVAPVLIVVTGSVPVVTPLANLVVAPAAELLGTAGLALALIAGFIPIVGSVARPLVEMPLAWVEGVARLGANVPVTLGPGAAAGLGAAAVVVRGASVACRRGSRAVPGSPTR